jgi:hypothetical protein
MFNDGKLYFPSPSSFNDPFDCQLKIDFNGTKNQWDNKLLELIGIKFPDYNQSQKQKLLKEFRDVIPKIDFSNSIFQTLKDEIGVLCLSEINNSILMWSHYSAGHTGFCLRFKFFRNNPFYSDCYKIKYEDKYPQLNYFESTNEERATIMLLSKSKIWHYEQEWRIIEYKNGKGSYSFSKGILTGIIFGAGMKDTEIDSLTSIIKSNNYELEYFQAKPADSEYKLEINEI